MIRRRIAFASIVAAILAMWGGWMNFVEAADNHNTQAEYDRPAGNPHQSRSAIIARNGIVATSQPLAAQVGLDILKAGGNAIDAAIAANAMIGLVEPMSCGIGGDLFVIYWDAKSKKLYGLNASGRSPYALNREAVAGLGLSSLPSSGPLSWSVPGCVDGWSMLHQRFGSMEWKRLLQPAIDHAENGFPVSPLISMAWRASQKNMSKYPDSLKTYHPDGHGPEIGEIFKNPYLAASYRAIADGGRDAFYKGTIAKQIVTFSAANGGYFSLKDFEDHTSDWVDPVSTNYRGYDVWELPPNGQGISVLQMLNVLEGFDLRSMGKRSADYVHLFVESKKLAYADRATYYADPAFGSLPISELISKDYAAKQRKRIDMSKAATDVPPGDPLLAKSDTIYMSVVDKDRNCCSLIQSNFGGFGSQVVPGDVGFVLQNRGSQFHLDPKHVNSLEPHKRPFHTIIPAFVTKDGAPFFCFGVMGGDMQPQGHVQVLANLIDFEMDVQEAGDAARVRHDGSQTPTGRPLEADGGSVHVESGIPDETIAELKSRGHKIERGKGGFGGYQGILIDHKHGVLHGGTEVRNDGAAVGY